MSRDAPLPQAAKCPRCDYPVAAESERCPECGMAADEVAAYTVRFNSRAARFWTRVIFASACSPWVAEAGPLALLALARLQLGRWPRRAGADSPMDIPLVRDMAGPMTQLLMLLPLTAIVGLGALVLLGTTQDFSRRGMMPLVRTGAIAGAVWVLGAWLVLSDPAQALDWLGD